MVPAVCTLYDNDYHLGAGALFNSLIRRGFRGTLVSGFRGQLPPWAPALSSRPWPTGEEAWASEAIEGCELVFVRLATTLHLTNYKPQFMLQVLDALSPQYLFYLDPDICITETWGYFDEWVTCGVALCEDVNSPIAENHPRRVGWRRAFAEHGFTLRYRQAEYVNGGLVGLEPSARNFLETWLALSEAMFKCIGGGRVAKVERGGGFASKGFASCFDSSDQDALNATVEATTQTVSILDRQAMGFSGYSPMAPHALGPDKPWQRNYLGKALDAWRPRIADEAYWLNCASPLVVQSPARSRRKLRAIKMSRILSRFYRR